MQQLSLGSLWLVLAKSFIASFVVLAIGLTLFQWVFPTTAKVPFWIFYTALAALLSGVWALATAMLRLWNDGRNLNPRLISVLPSAAAQSEIENRKCLLLATSSKLMSHGAYVSIYFLRNEFEVLIGVGTVINVQTDGRLQIVAVQTGEQNVWTTLQTDYKSVRDNVVIKPTIVKEHLARFAEE